MHVPAPGAPAALARAGAARDGLIEQAGRLGLSNIVFLPMQPKEHVPDIWSLCDAALVHLKDDPTFTEVIPSKIFEAMGMGLPILISAPEGEATQIVAAEYAGVVLPPEDPPALSAAVRSLRDDHADRRKYAENSLAAAPRYSRKKQADEMIRVFAAASRLRPVSASGHASQPLPRGPSRLVQRARSVAWRA